MRNRLVTLLETARLTHLHPDRVSTHVGDEYVRFDIGHARRPDVVLGVVLYPDGAGLVDCEALEPEFHAHFDSDDPEFAIELVSLILHGRASVEVVERAHALPSATVSITSAAGEDVYHEAYSTSSSPPGTRTVTWAGG